MTLWALHVLFHRHGWYLRRRDGDLECTGCGAVRHTGGRELEPDRHLPPIPSSHELDLIDPKESVVDKFKEYAKAVVAAVGIVVTLVQAALADQAVSLDEASGIWTAVLAAITVIATWAVPNREA